MQVDADPNGELLYCQRDALLCSRGGSRNCSEFIYAS